MTSRRHPVLATRGSRAPGERHAVMATSGAAPADAPEET